MSDSLKHAFSLPPDQQAIRNKCFHPSGSFVEFSEEEIEQSIPERFEEIVAQYPGRIAIKTKDKSLTYSELNQAANRIAHAILDKHGEGNYPVAILIEHGAEVLVAILGALKAGKIYVPLDPSYPLERLRFILRDAGANLIVTDHKQRVLSSEVAGHECQVMNAEEIKGDVAPGGHHTRVTPDALAYILYTSGSTGQPKGVVDNHRNVLHDTLRLTNCIHLSVEDRLSFTRSMQFERLGETNLSRAFERRVPVSFQCARRTHRWPLQPHWPGRNYVGQPGSNPRHSTQSGRKPKTP